VNTFVNGSVFVADQEDLFAGLEEKTIPIVTDIPYIGKRTISLR